MSIVFVGFETAARPDAHHFLPTPEAPSNWKDPAKIDRYVAEQQVKMAERAGDRPLTGCFTRVVILASGGENVYDAKRPVADQLGSYDHIACVEASTFRSLAIAERIDVVGSLDPINHWLIVSQRSGMPYFLPRDERAKAPIMFDPLHAITGSSADDCSDPHLVAQRYAVDFDRLELHSNRRLFCGDSLAWARAALARDLCLKLSL